MKKYRFLILLCFICINFHCLGPSITENITDEHIEDVLEEFTTLRINLNLYQKEIPSNREILTNISFRKGLAPKQFFDILKNKKNNIYQKLIGE
ncbi:MAG: hypothetical protein OEZ22_03645 [Spirochaetia bacterium]|nr:hypothetical protein [Spirochaetia bacterium]